jgi:hypothetical protein
MRQTLEASLVSSTPLQPSSEMGVEHLERLTVRVRRGCIFRAPLLCLFFDNDERVLGVDPDLLARPLLLFRTFVALEGGEIASTSISSSLGLVVREIAAEFNQPGPRVAPSTSLIIRSSSSPWMFFNTISAILLHAICSGIRLLSLTRE